MADSNLLQKIQDYFCEANGIYLACIDKSDGVLTKAYGLPQSKEFIFEIVDKDKYLSLVRKLENSSIENVIDEPLEVDYLRMTGIIVRVSKQITLMWIAVAIVESRLPDDVELPAGTLTTSVKQFRASIELLEVLTKQMLTVLQKETIANDSVRAITKSDESLKLQMDRTEAMNGIVTLLEAEDSFENITSNALNKTIEALHILGACLIKTTADSNILDVVVSVGEVPFRKLSRADAPFFNGKPYIISFSAMKPDKFKHFMEKYYIKDAIFLPIEIYNRTEMYLCFIDDMRHEWDSSDIKFINDTKRVVATILNKKLTANSLTGSYVSLNEILENSGCGLYVADIKNHDVLYMNKMCKEQFLHTIKEGKIDDFIFSNPDENVSFEECYIAEEDKWYDIHKANIKWVNGKQVRLCTIYDITDKKRNEREIEKRMNNDYLTGLYNRMRCDQDLRKIVEFTKRRGKKGALIYIDLDDFKNINDSLGHSYGDVLLRAVSHSLIKIKGIEDRCYRTGGDEFIAIVESDYFEEVSRIIDDIQSIFVKPWFLKGEDYYCTVSVGVACFPDDGESSDDIIRKADIALFSAKKKGKNCVEYYSTKQGASSIRRLDLEKHMRTAAVNDCEEFSVYFQPVIDSKNSGECCGAEALVRWNSTAMGFINPIDFIPLAEYLGLINQIGDHVMYEAAKHLKIWNDLGHPDYTVSVNLSVVQLLQNDIVKKIANVIKDTRVNPNNLCVEVTESLAVNDMQRMKKILSEFKTLGVRVALDDFGTGYSSLNHIREMPIDVIKIDKCFIDNVGQDKFSDAMIKMMRELANAIGVRICAEGVETKAQFTKLKKIGIDYIQGYYFDKPMCAQDFERKYI